MYLPHDLEARLRDVFDVFLIDLVLAANQSTDCSDAAVHDVTMTVVGHMDRRLNILYHDFVVAVDFALCDGMVAENTVAESRIAMLDDASKAMHVHLYVLHRFQRYLRRCCDLLLLYDRYYYVQYAYYTRGFHSTNQFRCDLSNVPTIVGVFCFAFGRIEGENKLEQFKHLAAHCNANWKTSKNINVKQLLIILLYRKQCTFPSSNL